ncbi:MAG: extracellular solute-binding protein [Bifidobacteriaceae bacterium]|jgi:cellobiose transport system substrate-binding protein|nr:extracellular solute-binding protein [Bifidobacteriaceae bacterium]MCI1978916.1 extracellular solute-binding protein [Bifidobacteriaceae bacterium]
MMKLKPILASAAAIAMLVGMAACGGSDSNAGSSAKTDSNEKITIKIQTFNNPGFAKATDEKPGADLYSKYEKLHPNVTIQETAAASSDDARAAFNTAISAGSNAFDVYLTEIDWMPSIMAMPDKFYDLKDAAKDNDWLDWKSAEATTSDGKLIGAGTDAGPEGICYRSDLLKKGGFDTDRAAVAKWLGGDNATWDSYFKAGEEYTKKTGKPWYDSMSAVYQGMINQIEESYVKKDGTIIAQDNAEVKKIYDQLTSTQDISAHLSQWSDDWNAAFKSDDGFATTLCPAWLVNNIKGNAGADFKGWDIADVFPGGGGNWGGSYLVVPQDSKVKEEAAKFAAWLTAPEQQVAVFTTASNFPSSPTAQKDSDVANKTDEFLNNAPTGQIFTNRADAVKVVPFKGAQYFDIQTKMADALNRFDVDKSQSASESWKQWLTDVKSLS